MNNEVRIPSPLNRATTSLRNVCCVRASQPALLVSTPGGSGTKVTWPGLTSNTRAMNSVSGYPSMLNSVVSTLANPRTSDRRIWRSSGLGCTVIPCAPNRSISKAILTTSGLFAPRALRKVASLLIFTLSRVMPCSLTLSHP